MNIPFLDNWRKRHADAGARPFSEVLSSDPQDAAELFSECAYLREQAQDAGVELDDSPESLARLDQLLPRWRGDPEAEDWLGTDAGLYLGTVLVRTVPGSEWRLSSDGRPVVHLPSGRPADVLSDGESWARSGAPELSQAYAERAEN